jgi:serine/threonine-protein kinase
LTGRVLDGRYRIDAKIARGGMATVYRAHDLRLDRVCAVKVMHSDLGDDHDFAARFVREAHSAARLAHPNVVSVSDQGDDDGVLFLVMEHVPGRTLRDVIRDEAPMAPDRALALVEPVLLALAEAHRCGLIHRDIKPENVLIADDGRVKVADFGLARAFDANTTHTATGGLLIGTVSYLAPELIVNGRADPRSDVYSAGVLLYELLTGRKPHEGDGAIQIAFKHVNEDIPAPSEITEQPIPAYVDALVLRATARAREHRQADAKVFLQQVRRVRAALDAGDLEDPELTADLLPTVPLELADSIDYTEETLSPVAGTGADREPTTVIDRVAAPMSVGASAAPWVTGTSPGPRPTAGPPPATPPLAGTQAPGRQRGPQPAQTPAGGGPRRPSGSTPVPRRRRSRRGLLLLVLVVALTMLTAYAGLWFGIGRYTTTPGLTTLSIKAATAEAQDAGLRLEVVAREFSETVTAGSVISTDPVAGARIVEGGTIEAIVSRGPERYEVPRLRGEPLVEADTLLSGANLTLGAVTEVWHETVPEGVIIAASPTAGTELRPDAAVDVTVSKGPRPIKIPDFTGKRAERAEARLTELGFEVDVTEEHSDEVDAGVVISQDPSSGKGFKDDTINLVVSKGPVLVEVPDLIADTVEQARSELAAVGLKIRVVETSLYIGVDHVVDQDPNAGNSIPKGSTVTVSIV